MTTDEPRLGFWASCSGSSAKDRANNRRTRRAMIAWGVSLLGGLLLMKFEVVPEGPIRWAVASLALVTGFWVMLAYARFLRETDELQRLIQLQALALGFGGSLFTLIGYTVLERAGAPPIDPGDFPMAMMGFFLIGLFLGWRRYR